MRELQSIADYGQIRPAIDPIFGALPEFYWSSMTFMFTPAVAWGVGFGFGSINICSKGSGGVYVRAVRGP